MLSSESVSKTVMDLLFFEKGAMSFKDKEIPSDVVEEILKAATSCAWLGKWRLISVRNRENKVKVVEVWQSALRKIGQERGAEFIERWKAAPLFVVFCLPRKLEPFQWVPSEFVKTFAIQEVGSAVSSLGLVALTHGIGLHGIMGILAIGQPIKEALKIPEDFEIVYFGILGYPGEEVTVKFPEPRDVIYNETWGNQPG